MGQRACPRPESTAVCPGPLRPAAPLSRHHSRWGVSAGAAAAGCGHKTHAPAVGLSGVAGPPARRAADRQLLSGQPALPAHRGTKACWRATGCPGRRLAAGHLPAISLLLLRLPQQLPVLPLRACSGSRRARRAGAGAAGGGRGGGSARPRGHTRACCRGGKRERERERQGHTQTSV